MISQINTAVQFWFEYIYSSSMQLVLFSLPIFILSFIFRHKSSQFLHLLWFSVIVKACIPPSLPVLPAYFPGQMSVTPTGIPGLAQSAIGDSNSELTILSVFFLLWCLVVVIFAGIVSLKNLVLLRSLKQSRIESDSLNFSNRQEFRHYKNIPVFLVKEITAPLTVGLIHPKIYLPDAAVIWNEVTLQSVLSHEIAHINRKDALTGFFQIIIQILYFFHPVIWITNWQINRHQEQACDDHAILQFRQDPKKYGQVLLSFLEVGCVNDRYQVIPGFIINNINSLKKRFQYLSKDKEERMLKFQRKEKIVFAALFVLAIFLSCQRATTHQITGESSPEEMLAERGMIVGIIMDAETDEPIPGANIFTSDTQYGAASNFAGNFEILLPAGKYTINTQMLGFAPKSLEGVEVQAGKQTKIQLKLSVDNDR